MRKSVWSIVLLLCTTLFLNGCVAYAKTVNNIDTWKFCVHGKSDIMANFGKHTAYADGRIYYLSAESGEQGLHSMALDGSDVRLEFATEDIRSLTVRNDTIWTAEYVGQDENDCGEYRKFGLFVRRGSADALPEDLLEQIDEQTRKETICWDENILDFYVATNDEVYFRCAHVQLPHGRRVKDEFALRDGKLSELSGWDYPLQIDPSQQGAEISAYDNEIAIKLTEHCLVYRDAEGHCAVYDLTEQRIGFEIDYRYDRDFFFPDETVYSDRVLIGVEGDRLLFVSAQELLLLQPETLQAQNWSVTSEKEGVYAAYHMGEQLYLLTRHWEEEKTLFGSDWIPTVTTLYRLDLETGEREQLLTIELPVDFVYLDENYAATAEGKTLTLYDIRGETAQEIRKIELSHKIVDKANKTDAAGGWWFLYRFNEKTNRDELIEKVRLY